MVKEMVESKKTQDPEILVTMGKIKQVETQIKEKNFEIRKLKKEIKRLEEH